MSDAAGQDEAGDGLIVVPLDEALRLAKPWTPDSTTGIEDVTDEERDAFVTALEQRRTVKPLAVPSSLTRWRLPH
jgi:hypothetical protein